MKPFSFVQLLILAPLVIYALPIVRPAPNDLLTRDNRTPLFASGVYVARRDDLISRSDFDTVTALVQRHVDVNDIDGVSAKNVDETEIEALRFRVPLFHKSKDLHSSSDAGAKLNGRLAEEIYTLLGGERVQAEKDSSYISRFQKDYNAIAPWIKQVSDWVGKQSSSAYKKILRKVQDLANAVPGLNAPF